MDETNQDWECQDCGFAWHSVDKPRKCPGCFSASINIIATPETIAEENEQLRADLAATRAALVEANQHAQELEGMVEAKNDALQSYAEFYSKAAVCAGLPVDALPSEATDAAILEKLSNPDNAKLLQRVEALRDECQKRASYMTGYCTYHLCKRCGYFVMQGYICFHCGYDGSDD